MYYNTMLANLEDISIGDAAITAVFGYAVVFAGLLILMIVLCITGAYFKSKQAKEKAKAEAQMKANGTEQSSLEVVPAQPKLAPGSAGHVKLYDVSDKEAAMIMAIVADKMQKPLNELRFISIKEVK
ncbi:MAG: OadG family protein [Ruminococcus sp.]|nr:OadG family protein [Ruminococcus sp.]